MQSSRPPSIPLRFGPFEVDLAAGELRKRGRKVPLQDQPFKILALVLQRPGELVTREEFQRALWPGNAFGEFDEGLNKAVQKLRQALEDSSDNPRFIETLPRKGYRFIAALERLADVSAAATTEVPDTSATPVLRRNRPFLWLLLGGVLSAAGVGVAWWMHRTSASMPLGLTQLTTDTGLTYQPALSPDGKLVAYASDRAGQGHLDIWLQQVPRGEPIRVTHDGADDSEPSFSPDGRSIVFRSDRGGGGIYVVSTLGGEARKIVEQGRQPRYSPDGAWIAYWCGPQHLGGGLYVVPSVGGQPKQLVNGYARSPVWTPDGQHVLFRTIVEDWWVVPLSGGPHVKTGVVKLLQKRGFSAGVEFPQLLRPDPELWLADGNSVVFSGKNGDSTELWKISISQKSWQVAGEPQRLTVGAGLYSHASVSASGRLVFSSLARNADVWSLPIDAVHGKVTGEMQDLTHDAADDVSPSVSTDGKHMVFESNRTGKRVVWTKDLETGQEKALTNTPSGENLPLISADGSLVAYVITNLPDYNYELYMIPFEGGTPKKIICDKCVQPLQWSSDRSKILLSVDDEQDPPGHLAWLDVRTGQRVKLLQLPKDVICSGWLPPDERWISFTRV